VLSHTLAALHVAFTWLLFHVKNVDPRVGVLAAMRQVLAALLGQLRLFQAMLCTYVVGRGARGGGLAPLALGDVVGRGARGGGLAPLAPTATLVYT